MKPRFILALLLLAASTGLIIFWWSGPSMRSKKNVVIICIDTCRADRMGWLGYARGGRSPTPNLDSLAAGADLATFGLTPVPLTLPAHVSMMSGRYPDRTGVRANDTFFVPAPADRPYPLLAEILRKRGYDTGAFVSAEPLERLSGLDQGFRVYSEPLRRPSRQHVFRERNAGETTEEATRWLRQERDVKRPYFLFVHYFDPHAPYQGHPAVWPTTQTDNQGAYVAEIAYVDQQIGRLLAELPDRKNTVVVVVGDHGESLYEHVEPSHGLLLHESTLRVPFLIDVPGEDDQIPSASVPPRLIDVTPTVLALLGEDALGDADGRDLRVPAGPEWSHRAETLYPYHQFGYAWLRSYRNHDRKLITGGNISQLFDWRDAAELNDLALSEPETVLELTRALTSRASGSAPIATRSNTPAPAESHPYLRQRSTKQPIEPLAEVNARLPHVKDRLAVVASLELARNLIASGKAGPAIQILKEHQAELVSNPSLLYWLARAQHLAARSERLEASLRLSLLSEAETNFRAHFERYGDPNSGDSLLRLWQDRHGITGDRRELEEIVRKALGRVSDGSATGLTLALEAQALEGLGRSEEALLAYRAALELDPTDERLRDDINRLKDAAEQNGIR